MSDDDWTAGFKLNFKKVAALYKKVKDTSTPTLTSA